MSASPTPIRRRCVRIRRLGGGSGPRHRRRARAAQQTRQSGYFWTISVCPRPDRRPKLNLKLQFDFYHCQIMHGDVTMRLREMMPVSAVSRSPAFLAARAGSAKAGPPFLFEKLDRWLWRFRRLRIRPRGDTVAGLSWFAEVVALALGCIADNCTGASDLPTR